MLNVAFVKLDPRATLPTAGTADSVGFDLYTLEATTVPPRGLVRLRTGIAYARKPSFEDTWAEHLYLIEAQIRARSSAFAKWGVIIPNAPGTVDPDYTGEFLIQVVNMYDADSFIPEGSRVAQIVFSVVPRITITEEKEQKFAANRGGFGSTG